MLKDQWLCMNVHFTMKILLDRAKLSFHSFLNSKSNQTIIIYQELSQQLLLNVLMVIFHMAITLKLVKLKETTGPVLQGGQRNSMEVLIGKNIWPGAIVEKDYVLIIAKNRSKILLVALRKLMLKSVKNAEQLTLTLMSDATPKYPENSLMK